MRMAKTRALPRTPPTMAATGVLFELAEVGILVDCGSGVFSEFAGGTMLVGGGSGDEGSLVESDDGGMLVGLISEDFDVGEALVDNFDSVLGTEVLTVFVTTVVEAAVIYKFEVTNSVS